MSLFISFEGCDGSGKTTQAKLLNNYLASQNIASIYTKEPGATNIGSKVRDLVLNSQIHNNFTELLLFMADRNEHIEQVIKPALAQGKVVICDRFVDSSAAYQSRNKEFIAQIYNWHNELLGGLMPDITILLTMDKDASFRRINRSLDAIENRNAAFFDQVLKNYADIAAMFPERIKEVNANQTEPAIGSNILDIVKPLLPKKA